jgi:RNA polymerase sigma-70 factor (ECF subfamily)
VSSQQLGLDAPTVVPHARPAGPTDTELLAAVAQGSEPAFEELRRRYRRAVDRVCRAHADREAEDCSQEVFARVWRKAGLFDAERGTPPAWLLTLARNVAINLRVQRIPEPVGDQVEAGADDGPLVERFWLESALERLPRHERTVLELAYHHDRSQSEIARELGVPLGTVKSWTRRGLNRLATLLGEESP